MARSTRSQEALTGTSDSYTEHEMTDQAIVFSRPEIGMVDRPVSESEDTEEPKSVGMDSSQSSKSEPSSSEHSTPSPRKPAQTTENPSNQPATEADSSASSTDGDGQRETHKPSARKRSARVRSTDDPDAEFDI